MLKFFKHKLNVSEVYAKNKEKKLFQSGEKKQEISSAVLFLKWIYFDVYTGK